MAAMTRFFLLFVLLSLASVISNSSRAIPSPVLEPSSSHPSPSTCSRKRGPILTNGCNYTYVCDPARFASMGSDVSEFGYCNKSLPYKERVKDLVGSMTLFEKIRQLGDNATGAPRIGLPPYKWWSEALHGVADVGNSGGNAKATYFGDVVPAATSFPTVILSVASFNETLWKTIGEAISTEARAMYNLGHAGLTFWSPNINVVRDPRWGRSMETAGEDPFVSGRYAINFVEGMQTVKGHEVAEDKNSRPLKVSSCCKHYAAYDLDNWLGVDRFHFDAQVTEQDMVETFLRPFEMCVKEGDVSSIMCSYNRVNGIPTCADSRLLSQTVREEWGLHGYIVSDCDSIEVMVDGHKWLADTPEDAVAQVLRAGLDLDCGSYYTNYAGSAVAQGRVREGDIDNALKNLFTVLMRLGFFDGMPTYESLGKDDICTNEHIQLAAEVARQGIVLLKNDHHVLPLNKLNPKSVALVGPHANATDIMIANYAGKPCRFVSPLAAISEEVTVYYKLGCDVECKNTSLIFPAMKAARKADATIIFAGLHPEIVEAEGKDRTDLLLPGYQTQLINQVAEVASGPVILVIFSGSSVDISFAQGNPKVKAILWAGYPGGEGGRAIADIIFGRHNPGGRLPLTWYESDYVNELPMTSMQLRPVDELGYPGRTYKFFNGSVVYPFGYGLSYTNFSYNIRSSVRSINNKLSSNHHCQPLNYTNKDDDYVPPCPAVITSDLPCDEDITFEIQVANTGHRDGHEAVLVYSKPPSGIAGAPVKQLVAFRRVFVAAGKSEIVKFSINACKGLGIVEKTAYTVLPAGEHTIVIGSGDNAVSFPVQVRHQF